MEVTRIEGWEQRLSELIEAARKQPYVLGEHDCLKVALCSVEAMTGRALWPLFQGRYSTTAEARRLIANTDNWPAFYDGAISREQAHEAVRKFGSHFDAAFSLLFREHPMPAPYARRGDVCKYTDEDSHLGVCIGATVAVLKADGLAFVPVTRCDHVWRIG